VAIAILNEFKFINYRYFNIKENNMKKYKLPDNTYTNSIPILCKTFQHTDDNRWRAEIFNEWPVQITSGCPKAKGILVKLVTNGYLNVREFLYNLLIKEPNLKISCVNNFFFTLSSAIISEIKDFRSIELIPRTKVNGRSWKNDAIVLPSLIYPNRYYWLLCSLALSYGRGGSYRIKDNYGRI
jgi:hypothetical protein